MGVQTTYRKRLERTFAPRPDDDRLDLTLDSGSRVGVIGGGPAGSFFSYFLLNLAGRVGTEVQVDIYEPRDFSQPGPTGCNMCGGIVSESLVQTLATEGINLPPTVVQRGIDSYVLHMDEGDVRIETPLHEKRIAAVHRGGGPRGIKDRKFRSFDGYLLELAEASGGQVIREAVENVCWKGERPQIRTDGDHLRQYDLVVVAVGINFKALKLLDTFEMGYFSPRTTKTFVRDYYLGEETVEKCLGSSMHVFLLHIPRLEFAAIIPKGDYVTVCLLGKGIDSELLQSFLSSPEVRKCMPPGWRSGQFQCQCSPRMNVQGAVQPFGDRIVFVGDCGVTRLYKDGIGAAYRTAKAAAVTAVLHGVSAEDFRRHYWPACRLIDNDNRIGKVIFAITREIQKRSHDRRGVLRMVSREQRNEGRQPRMSMVLWDTFTGSAPYREVFLRTLHPWFLGRLIWEVVAGTFVGFSPPSNVKLEDHP